MANPKEKTPMCLVNELARFHSIQPQYKLLNESGPAHSKVRLQREAVIVLLKLSDLICQVSLCFAWGGGGGGKRPGDL